MCGRYLIASENLPDSFALLVDELEKREQKTAPDFLLKCGEIRPGDMAMVLAYNKNRVVKPFLMHWGFRMDKRLVFNTRAETASTKPMFSESFRIRRCLVPATAYFEWDHRADKPDKYIFWPEGENMMYMAGLYRIEDDPRHPSFSILTTSAAEDISAFHDRMPVILPAEQAMQWLDPAVDPRQMLCLALEHMAYRPV